jgi:two-component system response regulator AtoC
MPKLDGLGLLRALQERSIESTIIMMSAYGTIDTAVEAMKLGAYDYISKPFKTDEIILTLLKAEERERLKKENLRLREEISKEYSFENIVSGSEKMHRVFDLIKKIADYKSTVLVMGDSGTGKELVARAIHENSSRRNKLFVAINCGAIPENLLESELFGHVKGAFTDAHRTKIGLFEEADGGTLFLDEIGELPLLLQVKLLRVLQDEEVRRVGDLKPVKVDVRVIAATTKDLAKEVEAGRFRDDLYYRLNVLPIHLPPLKERREDIPILAAHFIEKFNKRLRMDVVGISQDALDLLMNFDWQGNVRQLENTIERAMVLSNSEHIGIESLPGEVKGMSEDGKLVFNGNELSIKKATRILEADLIRKALKKTKGNRTHAARILEISHRALLYKIKEYNIQDF